MTRNLVLQPLIETQNPHIESLRSHLENQTRFPPWCSPNGTRIQVYQFWFNLRSSDKTIITFSTKLGLRQFKRKLKANTMKYLSNKNLNFLMADNY